MKATPILARASSRFDATGAIVPVLTRYCSRPDSLDRSSHVKSRVVALTCGMQALAGVEMALMDAGIPIEAGSGVAAAQQHFRKSAPQIQLAKVA